MGDLGKRLLSIKYCQKAEAILWLYISRKLVYREWNRPEYKAVTGNRRAVFHLGRAEVRDILARHRGFACVCAWTEL